MTHHSADDRDRTEPDLEHDPEVEEVEELEELLPQAEPVDGPAPLP